ncbi:MAG: aminoacyl-histidine dipeptidase [Roseburia sp.]|nr:aminoacyl-histidine dipeptidase [Roseburia sp.]
MLESIDYKKIFTYFEEISNVPRGSYHNEKISEYLVRFAKEHDLSYRVDEAKNVIIKKPASADCTNPEPVMLQGHMDMVCVSKDGTHDFEKEGLPLRIEGDYIYSEGTTLGGDDGIALAYALAILDSDEYTHPPIEAVFTTDEEVGMDGASALDTSDLKAKRLINMDNEEEGVLLVSCAGGASVDISFSEKKRKKSGAEIIVEVSGLAGGHSGTEIDKHPLNASILLGRLLFMTWNEHPFQIISFTGGDKDNVITSSANVRLLCEGDGTELAEALRKNAACVREEICGSEPEAVFTVGEPAAGSEFCFSEDYTKGVLSFLNLVITGVQVMSSDVPGMVESSLNMGVAKTEEDGMVFAFSLRSQKESYRDYMFRQLETLSTCVMPAGITSSFRVRGEYPAWDYKRDSVLRDLMAEEFRRVFGREPEVKGIHAGLECGILAKKIPGIDIVSMGPDIHDIHTVHEKLSISSAKKNFDFVLGVLEKLAK